MQYAIFVAGVDGVSGDEGCGFESGSELFGIGIFDGAVFPELFAGLQIEAVEESRECGSVDFAIGDGSTPDPAVGGAEFPAECGIGGQCAAGQSALVRGAAEGTPTGPRCWSR